MGIEAEQLRRLVIRPVLLYLDMHSRAAENLLIGTAAQESHLGTYIEQLGGGPARGIYQMEPATRQDNESYLTRRPALRTKVEHFKIPAFGPQLYGNLYYATALARIHYWRKPEPLPNADDLEGMARYWKQHYNTVFGRGTESEFFFNYNKFVRTL